MTTDKIRERIAETGKTKIKDIVAIFKSRYPEVDIKTVKAEAQDILKHLK